MSGVNVETSITFNHDKLGGEVWEWDADQQADFLAGFARKFRAHDGRAVLQIAAIADELRKEPWKIASVRWLNDHLTEYLKEEA